MSSIHTLRLGGLGFAHVNAAFTLIQNAELHVVLFRIEFGCTCRRGHHTVWQLGTGPHDLP